MVPIDALSGELRLAVRRAVRRPGQVLGPAAMLGLGLGAALAIGVVADRALWHPIPFPGADRLVWVGETNEQFAGRIQPVSMPTLAAWRERARTVDLQAYAVATPALNVAGVPTRVRMAAVTPGLLSVLGVPVVGRGFGREDNVVGAPAVALVSSALAAQLSLPTHGRGATIELAGRDYTVIGTVAPENAFPRGTDLWVPLISADADRLHEQTQFLSVIGRLRRRATLAQTGQELSGLEAQMSRADPRRIGFGAAVERLRDHYAADAAGPLVLLMGAAVALLLIGVANVIDLEAIRALRSRRDAAVRIAMGADARHLFAVHLASALLLAGVATVLGGALGALALEWLGRLAPAVGHAGTGSDGLLPGILGMWRALAGLVLVAASIGVGLAVLRFRVDRSASLGPGEHARAGTPRTTSWAGRALVVIGLSMAAAVLTDAGLLTSGLRALTRVTPGLQPDQILTGDVQLPLARYPTPAGRQRFWDALAGKLAGETRVSAFALTSDAPFASGVMQLATRSEALGAAQAADFVEGNFVSPGYFRLLGIRLVAGRPFRAGDDQEAPRVAVIDSLLAHDLFGSGAASGQLLQVAGFRDVRVIGVVAPARYAALSPQPHPHVYLSIMQMPTGVESATLLVRPAPSSGRAPVERLRQAARLLRDEVAAIDPGLPVDHVESLADRLESTLARPRLFTAVISIFAASALILAACGVYATVASDIAQRMRDFAIRVAIGARPFQIVGLIAREAGSLAVIGISLGLAAAGLSGRYLASAVTGVPPWRGGIAAASALTIGLLAVAAAIPAALRAATADPATLLKSE